MRLTQKQENFKNDIYAGISQRDAYINHYSTENMLSATIDRAAYALAQNYKIASSLEEMRQAVKSSLIADKEERQEILSEIARGRLTDYTNCGPDRDIVNVSPDSPNTAALQEVVSRTEYDKDGSGVAVVTKVRLHNPVPAIDLLNKMDGLYSDNTPPQAQVINSFVFVLPDGTRVTPKQLKGA